MKRRCKDGSYTDKSEQASDKAEQASYKSEQAV
jgi:hypothetical protein